MSLASTPFATIDTAIIRSSRPVFRKKGVLLNFAKFTRKLQKGIPAQMFSRKFCDISHKNFFKEPFGRLLLYKHFIYCPNTPFQKRCHTYFLAEYFFGIICRLGTKVSSIFKTLSQNT